MVPVLFLQLSAGYAAYEFRFIAGSGNGVYGHSYNMVLIVSSFMLHFMARLIVYV